MPSGIVSKTGKDNPNLIASCPRLPLDCDRRYRNIGHITPVTNYSTLPTHQVSTSLSTRLLILKRDRFGLKTCLSLSELTSNDLVVVDEKSLAKLVLETATHLPTVVLCSNSTRSQAVSCQNRLAVMEFVSKPFGPHKLAKALRLCLDKARDHQLGLDSQFTLSSEASGLAESEADTVIPDLEHLTIETGDFLRPLSVQTNGVVTASESDNAQMAIDHWNLDPSIGTSGEVTVTEGENFPFPDQGQRKQSETNTTSPLSPQKEQIARFERPVGDLTRRDSRRPPLITRMTEPAGKMAFPHTADVSFLDSSAITAHGEKVTFGRDAPLSNATNAHPLNGTTSSTLTASNMALHNGEIPREVPKAQLQDREIRPPRLLLVDDNKINLRLLETYMRKRKYQLVDSAENGQLAVEAAESHEHGYDIIFMGQSSPTAPSYSPPHRHQHANHERLRSHPRHPRHRRSPHPQ